MNIEILSVCRGWLTQFGGSRMCPCETCTVHAPFLAVPAPRIGHLFSTTRSGFLLVTLLTRSDPVNLDTWSKKSQLMLSYHIGYLVHPKLMKNPIIGYEVVPTIAHDPAKCPGTGTLELM